MTPIQNIMQGWHYSNESLASLVDKVSEHYPIHGAIMRNFIQIPLTEVERADRLLHSYNGRSCPVRYSSDRRREEKAAEVGKAIRARENRRRKKK